MSAYDPKRTFGGLYLSTLTHTLQVGKSVADRFTPRVS